MSTSGVEYVIGVWCVWLGLAMYRGQEVLTRSNERCGGDAGLAVCRAIRSQSEAEASVWADVEPKCRSYQRIQISGMI